MTGVTDVVSQLGGGADWRIGGGADSRNTERPRCPCPQRYLGTSIAGGGSIARSPFI